MRATLFFCSLLVLVACANQDAMKQGAALERPESEAAAPWGVLQYPESKRGTQVDEYHGVKVEDPYRWLEELDSADTRAWVDAQNAVTEKVLSHGPLRARFSQRMTELWNFDSFGVPVKEGGAYFYTQRQGLANQPVLYVRNNLEAAPRVLLDPNSLSRDGTKAVSNWSVSHDGRWLAYAVQDGGSDWQEWRIRDVIHGGDSAEVAKWGKFSGASWALDGSGFYYSAYDPPAEGVDKLKAVNENQKVMFHRLGQAQAELVYERKDQPKFGFNAEVSDDGRFLVINVSEGTDERNRLFLKDLKNPNAPVRELIAELFAAFTYLGNEGDVFWFQSDWQAPRGQIIAIDLSKPDRKHWRTLVPESTSALQSTSVVNDQFLLLYLNGPKHEIKRRTLQGEPLPDVLLPGNGSIAGLRGKRSDDETFFSFASYTQPSAIYRYLPEHNQAQLHARPQTPFKSEDFESKQVSYRSKDGARVPLTIVHRAGLTLDGKQPTLLYGYGGFNISILPSYSPAVATWLDMGGVYAVANLRGGGEFGRSWHEGGMKLNKQNVFDDFAAAAEYLIAEGYTSPQHLTISGRSNGGLLAAATAMQRPDLFKVAVPAVGVLDMLRFREFTIGWAWESDYGSVHDADEFAALYRYSPLHNLKPDVPYPAMMVLTGNHDDRVFPAHSFKFAAALQAVYRGDNPQLIRIETRGGHGAGKPTAMQISENADWMSLAGYLTGMR